MDNNRNDQYWIGLEKNDHDDDKNLTERQEGRTWIDGSVYHYTNWSKGEPSLKDDCVKMMHSGNWMGADCCKKYRYLCEKGIISITSTFYNIKPRQSLHYLCK